MELRRDAHGLHHRDGSHVSKPQSAAPAGQRAGALRQGPVHFSIHQRTGPAVEVAEPWMKVSYPFLHADRIHTPTLFLGGQNDFNVPIIGSEQMYQALRSLGVPTRVGYLPEQFHLFTRPSYIHDRLQRYVAWFDTYLHPGKIVAVWGHCEAR